MKKSLYGVSVFLLVLISGFVANADVQCAECDMMVPENNCYQIDQSELVFRQAYARQVIQFLGLENNLNLGEEAFNHLNLDDTSRTTSANETIAYFISEYSGISRDWRVYDIYHCPLSTQDENTNTTAVQQYMSSIVAFWPFYEFFFVQSFQL
ncbi:hypothetical protein P0136_05690 [Lentisphaerota bacterium ZTH]|nr:hypothetical protein JYG24_03200 [Lentisphaerota bacterium]WET07483.1 hypothetical protein P0136_05690 [Lentisphaerota bacterium ZTH]